MAPLKGMPLVSLECHGNPITDLSPLYGSSVQHLNIYKTKITDWSPLKSMSRLKMIGFDFDKARDTEILKKVTTLQEINEQSARDFWRANEQIDLSQQKTTLGDLEAMQGEWLCVSFEEGKFSSDEIIAMLIAERRSKAIRLRCHEPTMASEAPTLDRSRFEKKETNSTLLEQDRKASRSSLLVSIGFLAMSSRFAFAFNIVLRRKLRLDQRKSSKMGRSPTPTSTSSIESISIRSDQMDRRTLLVVLLAITCLGAAARLRRFAFKIRTKSGGNIGNVVVEANDVEAAK